ncbi:maltase A1-like [Aricia agestis]|uniref:maltase A1-like n=1 Tax=Aricia agestis TaxID=91739 RepID=UPI001C209B5B|nr:maltase A1-like [Aricia agestis]
MHAESAVNSGRTARAVAVSVTVMASLGLIAGGVTWAVLSRLSPPELRPLDWWEHCVLYQIHVRSYKDSDGDGIGDLNGVAMRLDHLKDAGVKAVWLSPIFSSPQVDFGYDISDYLEIHYEYGTMADFDRLVAKAHSMGIKILLDFVPNHSSSEHQYFKDSVKRVGEYADYYVWADGFPDPSNASNRLPPSNWESLFGGSMWEWNNVRKQFYLHQFTTGQPEFNLRNPVVVKKLEGIMKFWLDQGVDGFRLDALPHLVEAPPDATGRYPDNPEVPVKAFTHFQTGTTMQLYTKDRIETYPVLYEWRDFLDQYNEEHGGDTRIFLSEGYANISMTMLYYGTESGRRGAHVPFNFDFITMITNTSAARDFAYVIDHWLTYMPFGMTANWVFGNHDNNRMASRFRDTMVDGLLALDMMLPGVAITYQGEEIGMRDGYVSWEDTVDVLACNRGTPDTYLEFSRDPPRTPFHWDDSPNAGFSSAPKTWLPVGLDYRELNLAKQKRDPISHFKVYQKLTTLRNEKTLSHGRLEVGGLSLNTLYLVRHLRGHDTLVLLFNVGKAPDTVRLERLPYLALPATVYTSSTHSMRREGYRIYSQELTLADGEMLVLRGPPVTCY